MGLLSIDGAPMVWGTKENNRAIQYVRDHGIKQLLILYERFKDVKGSPFYWGDEIEHILVREDPVTKEVKLSLRAAPVLHDLCSDAESLDRVSWRPEYGSFMIESVPANPFTATLDSYHKVESNMQERMDLIDKVSEPGEMGVAMVSFPLLGVGNFSTAPPGNHEVPFSDSLFIPDLCINQTHPRFGNLTRNIRLRRGRKVCIQIPLFIDTFTLKRTVDPTYNIDYSEQNSAIDCSAVDASVALGGKRGRKNAFDSDEEEEEGKNGAEQKDDDEALARRKLPSGKTKTKASPATKPPAPTAAIEAKGDGVPAPMAITQEQHDFFNHLYTPSSDYYYAQYAVSGQSINVKQRYDACPCPVPSVDHPCIYMDCMAFGMGLSCLQVTMQLDNIDQARHIYDQVIPLCPVFLALTSATPFQKGLLCDSDVRWVTISASVDDRRPDEVPKIMKSRYDSVSMYISPFVEGLEQFNDNCCVHIDEKYYSEIKAAGIDDRLARHFAHLFIRDPLVIFSDGIEQLDDTKRSDHFENIQSTNWQTVRFKPPPYGGNIGWRVEFRVMEVMPTAFENAAFSIFVILYVQATLKFGTLAYIPMSLVDQNMGRAHHRDPCQNKYHFRVNMDAKQATDCHCREMSINEIFNGLKGTFEGLIPFVRRYLASEKINDPKLNNYIEFISRRASGELKTTANLFREFVMKHPDYKSDSRLTQKIGKDIVMFAKHLSKTQVWPGYLPEELTGGKAAPFEYGKWI